MTPFVRRNLDIFLAAILLVASSLLTIYAYAAAKDLQKTVPSLLSSIHVGDTNFWITDGAICPGEIRTRFIAEGSYAIRSTGIFRTSYAGSKIDSSFTLEAYFNPLRQFTKGELTIISDNLSLFIKATNPNPIDLTINSEGVLQLSQNISFPGPLMVEKIGRDTFQISYSNLPITKSPLFSSGVDSIGRLLQLTLSPTNNERTRCNATSTDRFDLTPIVQKMRGFSTLVEMAAKKDIRR